jgi:type VI secretion system protein ImpG
MRRDEAMADSSPGHGASISLVDIDFDPAAAEEQSLSLDLICSNGDLPTYLGYGQRGGDLFLGGGSSLKSVAFLRKPSAPQRFERGAGAHWRLVSHLALNHLSLSGGGVEALREMLALYDLPRSAATQRQIAGIAEVSHRPASAWLPGNPFACLARGVEITLAIDEEAFVGTGIHAFAHVLERFLGLYVHANSFTRLAIVSARNGEALLTLAPRSGELGLL